MKKPVQLNRLFFCLKFGDLEDATQDAAPNRTSRTESDTTSGYTKGKVAMDITVKAFSSPLLANALSYLVSVKKSGGRNNEYIVEIKRLPTMLQNCFGYYWSGYHLQNCCWLVDFYPYDALFSSEPGARYKVDHRMAFSYGELMRFLAEGVGQAVESFLQYQLVASVLAMPIHPALGKMYDRLLRRHAAEKGFIYNQTWLQEAVYVIEKK